MGYFISAAGFAIALALLRLVGETGAEYIAQYIANNEVADVGASTVHSTPTLAEGVGDPAAASAPGIGKVQPILFTGATYMTGPMAALSGDGAGEEGRGGFIPAVATVPAAPSPDMSWLQPFRDRMVKVATEATTIEDMTAVSLGAARDTPRREVDGTVFLPVSSQRLFGMRTTITSVQSLPMTYDIPGRIVTNAATGTMVTAMNNGIIDPVGGHYPYLGMPVKKGDILAYLEPNFTPAERAQIDARARQLANLISLTTNQIARLEEVLLVRYRANKIAELRFQIEGYRSELAALTDAQTERLALRANADGVISAVHVVANGAVILGAPIFEIVDPTALWVEGAAFNPAIASNIMDAGAVTADGRSLALEFIGGGLTLSNQAIPLRFQIVDGPDSLTVGTPVTVVVRSRETVEGVAIPASCLVRNPDGQEQVWEKLGAERFIARIVQTKRLAGDSIVVTSGLSAGQRIVTEGSAILSQVR
jgi:cobalt-zinc-cadmium efflux system membrane fusion protein